ncbi:DUF2795 domain-containing protein [Microbacterium sp. EST19A]|uniref:DUF2795 domain-containing protein n=1 Tax=Microbacterium sp. EST19A TaxID=2862681 RepID=UPI001CBEC3EA|nr:DUF2795 domain-containing protein [Microbacterium sp. EST19A]
MALPASLDRFLAEMEYPATRDDLLREATRDGLPADDRALLQDLPEQNYSAAWHLRLKLASLSLSDSLAPSFANA